MKTLIRDTLAFIYGLFLVLSSIHISTAASSDAPPPRGYVGIRVKPDEQWLAVDSVMENSPASRAGLKGGERILKIDGQSTQNKPLAENAKLLAGATGGKVTLTLLRPDTSNAQPFEVTLVREPYQPSARFSMGQTRAVKADWTRPPTREAGNVEWKGDKIVSRVMPYPDFVSLFIRLPIAHAAALGDGVKVAVIQFSEDTNAQILVENVAPRAEVETLRGGTNETGSAVWEARIAKSECRLVLIADPIKWPSADLVPLVERLTAKKLLVVVPSDLSEDEAVVNTINKAQAAGALTVGRTDRQSMVLRGIEGGQNDLPFNQKIKDIHTDIFSTVGVEMNAPPVVAAATAVGVAALVIEKWPQLSAPEIRQKMLSGARPVWQMVMPKMRMGAMPFSVDPVTTEFKPKDETNAFRFRALDAAGPLGIDTEMPWFLNMLNCKKAWEITRGKGIRAVITDQGFHIRHPTLASNIESTKYFGPMSISAEGQNFHGTDMSRIFLAIAPEARIIPVLCSGEGREALTLNIAKSFRVAAELKADVISGSWAGWFNSDTNLLAAVREAVDSGVAVSWFHYPKAYPGLVRSTFTYGGGWDPEPRLGFPDRFLTDPPGFHPVEIESGLSGTAPQAAGIAALIKSVNPNLTPKQIENLMFKNATPIPGGMLIPDAWKTVMAALIEGKD